MMHGQTQIKFTQFLFSNSFSDNYDVFEMIWESVVDSPSGKTKNQMGGCGLERCSTIAGDKGME
jgi:hypothetical protein